MAFLPLFRANRRKADDAKYRTTSREEAENRYARETMNKGNPQTPDVAGPGIFRGPATIGGICGIGLGKCPPPPAKPAPKCGPAKH